MAEEHCPVCGADALDQRGVAVCLPLLQCRRCGHNFARLTADAVDLEQHYDAHYEGFRNDPVFARRVREKLRGHILGLLPPNARVLDVGCGAGEFLAAAKEAGLNGVGIDFSEAAAQACRARGLEAFAGDFLTADFGRYGPFDLVTLWDVCEHLPNPLSFVQRAHELLKPGGYFVLKSPLVTRRAVTLARTIPRLSGMMLGAPSHVQYFRRPTLEQLLHRGGFAEVRWLPVTTMRGQVRRGGLKKRLGRGLKAGLHWLAGDGNLLVAAQRANAAVGPARRE